LSQVLHPIEKQIIKDLKEHTRTTQEEIVKRIGLSIDQVRRGTEWLKLKDLVDVEEIDYTHLVLNENGINAKKNGLPERQLFKALPLKISELQNKFKSDFAPAIGILKKNNWIEIKENLVLPKEMPSETLDEKIIAYVGETGILMSELSKEIHKELLKAYQNRPHFYDTKNKKTKYLVITEQGKKIDLDAFSSNSIDVEAKVPHTHAARIHPLKETINEIREIFVSLGFSEVLGNLSQSSFWNFDALFTPQDHPAREMQDTFYIKDMKAGKFASSQQITNVSRSHKLGWRYNWNISEAQKMALRTHTTCVTIKHLADNKPDEARIFSLGRVFRNEKVSYKHLAEFNQVEGVVIGNSVTLRDLMGLQEEFYRRIGLTKIKFWPTFFPYTEPSLQSMVYNDRLGKWIELFGMGIFRPEVTKPLGISKPVLAWGGGIERIAMLKYGVDDVREFYNNNLSWLRSVTKCQ